MENNIKELELLYNKPMAFSAIARIDKYKGIKLEEFKKLFKVHNIPWRGCRTYTHQYDYFENINHYKKAYWLGFLFADGGISNNSRQRIFIEIHPQDIAILENFKKDIKATNKIITYHKNSTFGEQDLATFRLTSKKTRNDLVNLGFTANKTYDGCLPELKDENMYRYMLLGYLDGDGNINKRTGYISFTGTKENLAFVIQLINQITGINITWRWDRRYPDRDNNNYSISVRYKDESAIALRSLYSDLPNDLFRLKRKEIIASKFIQSMR